MIQRTSKTRNKRPVYRLIFWSENTVSAGEFANGAFRDGSPDFQIYEGTLQELSVLADALMSDRTGGGAWCRKVGRHIKEFCS